MANTDEKADGAGREPPESPPERMDTGIRKRDAIATAQATSDTRENEERCMVTPALGGTNPYSDD
jgi:hypothetical protein